jgi:PAS domain S-box-containing protein
MALFPAFERILGSAYNRDEQGIANTMGHTDKGSSPTTGAAGVESPPIPAAWGEVLPHLPTPVYLCDTDGYLTHYNDAAAELWGRKPRIGVERWSGALHLFDADGRPLPHDQCLTARAIRGRETIDAELLIERPDGSRRSIRVHCAPIFADDGAFLGGVTQVVDGASFKETDHARARLAALVECSDDAIVSKNLDGIIMSWNRAAERVFGYRADEAVGQPITMLIPDDRLDEEPEVLARIRRGELVDHFETIRRRKDGTLIDISLTISPIRNAHGTIVAASKIARDISDRKAVERSLADADRKKDEFIATMAHELRNPLAPLKTSLHLIQMSGYDGHVPRSTLQMMQRQVGHLIRLVEDLLDISRISHGTIVLKKEVVAVADVVSDAIEIVTPKLEAKGHQLDVALPPNLRVAGDRTRLTQVLANLLNNAAKFTPAKGSIKLSAEGNREQVWLRVQDNGVGIAAEDQQAVFGMFARVHNQTGAEGEGGLGIGLSLAQHLVALHGGTIGLHSDGQGRGTEFIVSLPCGGDDPVAAQPVSAGAVEEKPSKFRRVLIVDDNVDAADSLQVLLESLGHEAVVAHSGEEGLARARQFRPQVVLLDIGLPDFSGNEVAARMRQEAWSQGATLVALTGWGQAADRKRSAAAGFDHHFVKPLDLNALEQLLQASSAAAPH